jgi:hypothetical protein
MDDSKWFVAPQDRTLLFLLPVRPARAQVPAFLHAISDLRTAREFLKADIRPGTAVARSFAIDEIRRAIDEMKKAAVDDGKNIWHAPEPQSGGNPNKPIHSAVKLLKEVRHDVDQGEDAHANAGLRVRSLEHVDKALQALTPLLY